MPRQLAVALVSFVASAAGGQLPTSRDVVPTSIPTLVPKRLTLARGDSTSVVRVLPSGLRIRHTVVAHAVADTLLVESRVTNLGATPIDVQLLCYPSAYAAHAVAPNPKFGPACYSMGETIAPGDSLRIASDAILAGQPGHYRFRVHVINLAETDAYINLKLVAVRSKSPHGA